VRLRTEQGSLTWTADGVSGAARRSSEFFKVALSEKWPKYPSYVISFTVIGGYWRSFPGRS